MKKIYIIISDEKRYKRILLMNSLINDSVLKIIYIDK